MDTRLDAERCYRAVAGRDARFDGIFYTAVRTTGIYCRPSCPATTPRRGNVTFYRSAAAAQIAGYRACRRCRPDAVPGSPEWNVRADLVGRVMRLVADGAVDRIGVSGVASTVGFSARHLNRMVTDELGAGVLAVARAQRAQTARILLETTEMPVTEVAWAAGFGSVRSFNDTIRAVFAVTPSALRTSARRSHGALAARVGPAGSAQGPGDGAPTPLTVRLPARAPFDARGVLAFLGDRTVAGCEAWDGETYRRALALPHGHATIAVRARSDAAVTVELRLADLRDLAPAVARARRLLDLDADPQAVAEVLGADPLLAPLVAARPGLRVPGCPDAAEVVVRAIVGQQVSVAGARTIIGGLVREHGTLLAFAEEGLDRVFPDAQALAGLDPERLPMPRSRGRTLVDVCAALADGTLVLDAGVDRAAALAELARFRGIGPWTTQYVALRGLGDPDVLLASDLGVRRALARLGADDRPAQIEARGAAWRPWRSYAVAHLWASLAAGGPSPGSSPSRAPAPHPDDSAMRPTRTTEPRTTVADDPLLTMART